MLGCAQEMKNLESLCICQKWCQKFHQLGPENPGQRSQNSCFSVFLMIKLYCRRYLLLNPTSAVSSASHFTSSQRESDLKMYTITISFTDNGFYALSPGVIHFTAFCPAAEAVDRIPLLFFFSLE